MAVGTHSECIFRQYYAENIAVIPWFNFTTFDVVGLKACSTLESSVVVIAITLVLATNT